MLHFVLTGNIVREWFVVAVAMSCHAESIRCEILFINTVFVTSVHGKRDGDGRYRQIVIGVLAYSSDRASTARSQHQARTRQHRLTASERDTGTVLDVLGDQAMKTFIAFLTVLLLGALSASVLAIPCPPHQAEPNEVIDTAPQPVPLYLVDARQHLEQ